MRRIFIAAGAAAISTAAFASDVPRYDPASYCRTVADTVGGSSSIEQACMRQQQSAYDELSREWVNIPDRAKSYCDQVAEAVGGSYEILSACIRNETEAAGEIPAFKF